MKVFAISDLHLSINNPKPMDVFGGAWEDYLERIETDWRQRVGPDDLVLVPGDISWAMELRDALPDLKYIGALPGVKVLLRGNHDYWWKSISALRQALPPGVYAVQNDSLSFGSVTVCGSRGWTTPEGCRQSDEDKRIYEREIVRMRLSLESAVKSAGEIIAMIHFPPFNSRYEESPFTGMFEKNNVKTVVYGHLHGKNIRSNPLIEKNGVNYYLVSCDQTDNKLIRLM